MGARSIGAATWRSLARAQRTSEIFYNKERETSYVHVISSTYLIDLVVYVFWLRFNHVNQYRVSYWRVFFKLSSLSLTLRSFIGL